MTKGSKKLKRVCLDFSGYCLILIGVLVGWLPGPGFVPLSLAGLALLSIHNPWAKRLRHYLEQEGLKLLDRLFPDDKQICRLWDRFNLIILALTIGLVVIWPNLWGWSLAGVTSAANLIIWGRNRRHLERLLKACQRCSK